MKATIQIDCRRPELIITALRPDIAETRKFTTALSAKPGALELSIEAADISSLLAGINSYLRLIKAALAAEALV